LLDSPDITLVAVYEKLVPTRSYIHVEKRFQVFDVLVLYTEESVETLRRKFQFSKIAQILSGYLLIRLNL
jgi:hypothetical protein